MGRRIAVTGGRDLTDSRLVSRALQTVSFGPDDTLVHGACRGADALSAAFAARVGHVEAHPADWRAHGRAAGPIRNRTMLATGIDLLIAFPGGAGTRDCIKAAGQLGVPVAYASDLAREHERD